MHSGAFAMCRSEYLQRICKLDFVSTTGCRVLQDFKHTWMKKVPTNNCQVAWCLVDLGLFDESIDF